MTSLIPAVQLVDGHPRVSSLSISEHFEKRHAHVVESVRKIAFECAQEFSEPNFWLAEYADEQGKMRPFYLLSRDGFTLVAMGFTGKKALAWKIRYIEAFNKMEQALLAGRHGEPVAPSLPISTADDRAPLRALVAAWAQASGQPHQVLWPQVRAHFQLSRIDDLPVEWIPDALAFVQGKIDALVIPAAPVRKALPAPRKEQSNVVLYGTPKFFAMELEKKLEMLRERENDTYHWLGAFERELAGLTGPLFKLVLDALPAPRGLSRDQGVNALHFSRYAGTEQIRNGFDDLLDAVRQALYFAKALQK